MCTDSHARPHRPSCSPVNLFTQGLLLVSRLASTVILNITRFNSAASNLHWQLHHQKAERWGADREQAEAEKRGPQFGWNSAFWDGFHQWMTISFSSSASNISTKSNEFFLRENYRCTIYRFLFQSERFTTGAFVRLVLYLASNWTEYQNLQLLVFVMLKFPLKLYSELWIISLFVLWLK